MTRSSHPVTTIHVEIGKGSQDRVYTEVLALNDLKCDFKCRIWIKSDAYEAQSHAIAEVWSRTDLCWNQVVTIHYSRMKTETGLAYKRGESTSDNFRADRDELVQRLQDVLLS